MYTEANRFSRYFNYNKKLEFKSLITVVVGVIGLLAFLSSSWIIGVICVLFAAFMLIITFKYMGETTDKEIAMLKSDIAEWSKGNVQAEYETIIKVVKLKYLLGLDVEFTYDKIDGIFSITSNIIKYREVEKAGEEKKVSKAVVLNWKLLVEKESTDESFCFARTYISDVAEFDLEKDIKIVFKDNIYLLRPVKDTCTDSISVVWVAPLSNDYYAKLMQSETSAASIRFYFKDGTTDTIELDVNETKRLINHFWLANALSNKQAIKSPLYQLAQLFEVPDNASIIDTLDVKKAINKIKNI